MTDVPLLMSLRDQLIDMTDAMKAATEPEVITDEKERHQIHRMYGYCPIAEYHFEEDSFVNMKGPVSVKFWRKLQPLNLMLQRIERYIEAAKKQSE